MPDPRLVRANPTCGVTPLDRSLAQRSGLPLEAAEGRLHLVQFADRGRTVRVVGDDVARLLREYALARPLDDGPVPDHVGRLALDGLLQVRAGRRYVDGAAAAAALYGEPAETRDDLSTSLIRHVGAVAGADESTLARRLYTGNRTPASRRALAALGRHAVVDYLAGGPASATDALLRTHWRRLELPRWIVWRRLGEPHGPPRVRWKLYVGTRWDTTGRAFRVLVPALTELGAYAFKVGAEPSALLRPDALVAYFHSGDSLRATADALAAELGECQPQAVPFAAPLTDDGALSWAVDPPGPFGSEVWERLSWRLWVVRKLAAAMAEATAPTASWPLWQVGLLRLRLEGVDVDRWTPPRGWWAMEEERHP